MENRVNYDDFSETFGKSRENLRWTEIDDILSDFVKSWLRGNIFDIGCGNGRLLSHISSHIEREYLEKNITSYAWLDASEGLISQAKKKEFDLSFPLHWMMGDMRDLSSLKNIQSFSAIFLIASFHHLLSLEERISVLSQIKNLLLPGGKIYLLNWHLLSKSQSGYHLSCTKKYPNNSADFSIKIGKFQRFYHAFSPEEYEKIALESWLSIQKIEFLERNSILILSE